MTKSIIYRITVAAFIFTLALVVFPSMVKADDYTDREVEFRGLITSDEEWGGLVAYGSYYCNVMVTEIIYDPKNTLSLNQNVTIAYEYQLNLRLGETVTCYGINGINCTVAPKQCYGYVVCKPTPPYYVTRCNVTKPPKLLLTTDKQSYMYGENVTIILVNIGNETVPINGYPAWQIYTYPEEKPVYPKVLTFLEWSLEPGENDTFVWQQVDEFDGECEPGIYIIKDTQGWGLACTFEITSTPFEYPPQPPPPPTPPPEDVPPITPEFPVSAYLMILILLIASASPFALRRALKSKPYF